MKNYTKIYAGLVLSLALMLACAMCAYAGPGDGSKPGNRWITDYFSGDLAQKASQAGFASLGGGTESADPVLGIVPEASYTAFLYNGDSYQSLSSRSSDYIFAPEGFQKLFMSNVGVGRLYFRTYTDAHGWSPWAFTENKTVGNDDGARVQAIQIRGKGYHTSELCDVCYKVMLNDGTVLDWCKNGQTAGTMGTDRYIVAFAVTLTNKGVVGRPNYAMAAKGYEGVYLDTSGNAHYSTFDGRAYTGWGWYEKKQYYFVNNEPVTGWQYIDGYKYYLDGNGATLTDLEPVMGLPGSYQIKYNKSTRTLYVMAFDPDTASFCIPYKTFMSSCGPDTPIGTYDTYAKYDWKFMHAAEDGSGDIYCQKLTRFYQGFLMHSLLYYHSANPFALDAINYNFIDYAASGGCIRLRACDANWIYNNVPLHTPVTVYQDITQTGPVEKDAIMQAISREQNYDPTDPEALAAINAQGDAAAQAALAAEAQAALDQAAADDAAAGITATE